MSGRKRKHQSDYLNDVRHARPRFGNPADGKGPVQNASDLSNHDQQSVVDNHTRIRLHDDDLQRWPRAWDVVPEPEEVPDDQEVVKDAEPKKSEVSSPVGYVFLLMLSCRSP
jgi:hypothetical protein